MTKSELALFKAVTAELKELTEGEYCDHSVGICWCETFRVTQEALDLIRKAEAE